LTRTQPRLLSAALAALLAVALLVAAPPPADAHPDACEKTEESGTSAFQTVLGFVNVFASFFDVAPSAEAHEEECFTEAEIAALDDSGATLRSGETASSKMTLLANLPKSGPLSGTSAYNSDLAFWGNYAIQGNYNGFQVVDIRQPREPQIVGQVDCPGSQNDVSAWRNLVVTSTDSIRTDDSCASRSVTGATARGMSKEQQQGLWEGIRVWDWSNPASPQLLTNIKTFCGSHTHTILPDEANDRVLVYVSSYDIATDYDNCNNTTHGRWTHISVVDIPLSDPTRATVTIHNPWEGTEFTPVTQGVEPGANRTTAGCHDITVYQAKGLAAGACTGEGVIFDISNPEKPTVISQMVDENFVFWHSATFSHDGRSVLFTDELGGGGSPTCNPGIGPKRGANGIYDITDPTAPIFASYWKLPRTQSNTENCVAHNGNLLPIPGKSVFVQSWYQGGIAVTDWTDPYNPRELAWFDRGPLDDNQLVLGGTWSAYWYNGHIYSSDIQQGFDVFELSASVLNIADRRKAMSTKLRYHNAQTQEPL